VGFVTDVARKYRHDDTTSSSLLDQYSSSCCVRDNVEAS